MARLAIESLAQKTETRVLVVDDDEFNRLLLVAPLERLDYEVREAENGKQALEVVDEWIPDLILLDIMMPEIDGIEVCNRLKADEATRIIPIIMVSALDETEHRIKAIEAGADDFLNKPIDLHEVLLRVNNAVRMKKLYDEVQKAYRELERLQSLKEDLTSMIVHDIRSPLAVVQGHLELLLETCDQKMEEEQRDWFRVALESARGIDQLSMTLLTIQKMESGEMPVQNQNVEVIALCREALESFHVLATDRSFEVACVSPEVLVTADPELLGRVLHNLVGNARKFTLRGSSIVLRVSEEQDLVRISCEDDGPGIPEDQLDTIFDKYSQADERHRRMGVGLGLAFCKMAAEAMDGSISVVSVMKKGSTFTITLPKPS